MTLTVLAMLVMSNFVPFLSVPTRLEKSGPVCGWGGSTAGSEVGICTDACGNYTHDDCMCVCVRAYACTCAHIFMRKGFWFSSAS